MGMKTDEEIAREAFKQELLHTSNWGLRRLAVGAKGANVEIASMKKADETGPEAVIELILEKYDDGWRPGSTALNAQSRPAKTSTKEAPPDEEPANEPDNPPEEEGDPWDDIGTNGAPLDLDNGVEKEPDPEPAPEPEPKKRQRRTTKTTPATESSALEEKVDKILDTLMKMAMVISKLEKAVSSVDASVQAVWFTVIEGKEVSTVAFGGLFNRLSIPKYNDVVLRANKIAHEICGSKD